MAKQRRKNKQKRNKNKSSEYCDEVMTMTPHIPIGLVRKIMMNLDIKSVAQFSTVSKAWNHEAVKSLKSNRNKPCMLLSSIQYLQECHIVSAGNIDMTFDIKARGLDGKFCVGSSSGWLILRTVSPSTKDQIVLSLWNPFSKVRIDLPKLFYKTSYLKVYLSSAPTDETECFLLAKTLDNDAFMWKFGEEFWDYGQLPGLSDFVMHKGVLYALDRDVNLYSVIDFIDCDIELVSLRPSSIIDQIMSSYLFGTTEGLWLVLLLRKDGLGELVVFKLDSSANDWVKVERLDERTIFLDEQHSFMVSSREANCEANCIYLLDPNSSDAWLVYNLGSHETTTSLKGHKSPTFIDSKYWIVPNF